MSFDSLINFFFGVSLFFNAMLFVPQIIKLIRMKDARDFSKITFVGFCLMQLCAILYGVVHHDFVLVVGYSLSLLTCGTVTILIFKFSYRKS